MNICIFTAYYLPNLGGVERYTYNIAKKLINKGNKVTIVTSSLDKQPHIEKNEGISIYRIPSRHFLKGRFPVIKRNRIFREIKHKLHSEHFDLNIIQTRFYQLSMFASKLAFKKNEKAIVIEHGSSYLTMSNCLIDKAIHLYEHWVTHFIKKYINHYYGVSKACCDWLMTFNIIADGVLYNCVDLEEIDSINSDSYYRKKYLNSSNNILVVFCGRLLKSKGVLKAIHAVKQYNQRFSNKITLLIAGDGPDLCEVTKLEDSHVRALGALDHREVIGLLKEADLFLFPTEYPEGFSTGVLEAAVCNCFIITSKKGSSEEIIPSKDYGIVVSDVTDQSVYEALIYSLSNPNDCNKCKENVSARVRKYFIWENTANKIYEISSRGFDD